MADERVSMPSGYGGLVRYYDEYKSKLKLKPAHVIILVAIVVALEVVLHLITK